MLLCVLVCVSVAFKFLKRVTDCYKFGVNIMMIFGWHRDDLSFSFQTLSNKKVEDKQTCVV